MWHKKLITTLVFQVTTSGSLPNFAGWSQVSHKINIGRGQPRQLHPLISPTQPLPRMPRPYGAGRLLPPPVASRMHRDALPAGGTGELWESQTAYLLCSGGAGTGGTAPAETRFPAPCSPGWGRPGRAAASPQAAGEGAAPSPGTSRSEPVITRTKESGQRNPARPTRR